MRSILAAVDGSAASADALDMALWLAHETGAAVTAIAVSPLLPLPLRGGTATAVTRGWDERKPEDVLEAARQRAAHAGLQIDALVSSGEPAAAICAAAEQLDADLVVVGSRGRGSVSAALLGSVSRDIVTRASRPVLVVKHRPETELALA